MLKNHGKKKLSHQTELKKVVGFETHILVYFLFRFFVLSGFWLKAIVRIAVDRRGTKTSRKREGEKKKPVDTYLHTH